MASNRINRIDYNKSLDGIRALAILAVIAFHARVPGFGGGFLGVDTFFVLSGYLITRLLYIEYEDLGSIDISRFYFRRMKRLYPALLLFLSTYLTVSFFHFDNTATHSKAAALAAGYFTDYSYAFWKTPSTLIHTWSLSVEVHFYLLLPVLFLFFLRIPTRASVMLLVFLAILATAWRGWVMLNVDPWVQPYYRFDTRLSGLLLGCAIGIWRPNIPAWSGWLGCISLATCFIYAKWNTDFALIGAMGIAEISAAFIILTAERLPLLSHFAWLGQMSYGMYLWHYPIVLVMRDQESGWLFTVIVAGLLSLALAAISYYTVEARFRNTSFAGSAPITN